MVQVSSGDGKEPKNRARMVMDATAGAIAGCVARFITGPLDVIKIRFQVQLEPISGSSQLSKYKGFGQALTTIAREEGIQVSAQGATTLRLQRPPHDHGPS